MATRAGGTETVVDDGESGFLAGIGDVGGLASRLAELARDPERAEQMGHVGAERVRERFGLDRMVDDVDRLYESLLPR